MLQIRIPSLTNTRTVCRPPSAHPVRDHHDTARLGGRDRQCRVREDPPAEAGGAAEEQPVLGVRAERGRPGAAVQHGPQLGGRHHRQGLYRAAEGDLRQVSEAGASSVQETSLECSVPRLTQPNSSSIDVVWCDVLRSGSAGANHVRSLLFASRILFEKRQANDAIELLRVLSRSRDVTLEIHRNTGSGDPLQLLLLAQEGGSSSSSGKLPQ